MTHDYNALSATACLLAVIMRPLLLSTNSTVVLVHNDPVLLDEFIFAFTIWKFPLWRPTLSIYISLLPAPNVYGADSVKSGAINKLSKRTTTKRISAIQKRRSASHVPRMQQLYRNDVPSLRGVIVGAAPVTVA
jgi:hypothetical protein